MGDVLRLVFVHCAQHPPESSLASFRLLWRSMTNFEKVLGDIAICLSDMTCALLRYLLHSPPEHSSSSSPAEFMMKSELRFRSDVAPKGGTQRLWTTSPKID